DRSSRLLLIALRRQRRRAPAAQQAVPQGGVPRGDRAPGSQRRSVTSRACPQGILRGTTYFWAGRGGSAADRPYQSSTNRLISRSSRGVIHRRSPNLGIDGENGEAHPPQAPPPSAVHGEAPTAETAGV